MSPVEKLEWQNPHVHVELRHEGANWTAVLAPPFRMTARGLKPEMIKEGAQVSVEGYASTPTSARCGRSASWSAARPSSSAEPA